MTADEVTASSDKTVADLVDAMEAIAPASLAESWDNVGLVIGDPDAVLTGVLLCIDLTLDVIDEAKAVGAAVVPYHPPIFKGIKRLVPGSAESAAYEAMQAGLAVYSPHTALDVAAGGTNDVLADLLGLHKRRPLSPRPVGDAADHKLVTFVPADAVAGVADALFDAGAGRIGDYERCSFQSPGIGTFRGGAASDPVVGERGRDERVDEVRLEVVVPANASAAVVAALRANHPYEEVAFDLYRRAGDPTAAIGLGRIGDLAEPMPFGAFLDRVRRELDVPHVLVAGPTDREVGRVAVCAGSCGDHLDDAAAGGADVYVTGELRHHDALRAARLGLTAVCVLHSNSERPTLAMLARRLSAALPGVTVKVSERDRDPFSIV